MTSHRDEELITSLYQPEEREVIERWLAQAPVNTGMPLADASQVAELALCTVRDQLPQWWAVRQDGHVMKGRKIPLRVIRKIDGLLNPVFLFMINWADSGPGYSWPESYYAVHLPGYNVIVVTASQDSTDAYGYADIAIGYFDATADLATKATRLIEGWWRYMYDAYGQEPWEEELGGGELDLWDAKHNVWKECDREDDELEDDSEDGADCENID